MNRFSRQTVLPEMGEEGQQKLAAARVLVVGAGGLGCPALTYLAAAGVGKLGIVDGDSISESNLNRQTLFGQQDIGKPKAATAAKVLREKYPEVDIEVFPEYLSPQNVAKIISGYDLILDGTDNFGTRYLVNDAAVLLKKPLITGAIYKFEGQLTVLNFGEEQVNYRDIYPEEPTADEVPNCEETGVLGVLPGIVGTLMASEAIKVITGIGEVLSGRMLLFNMKTSAFSEIKLAKSAASAENLPKSIEELERRNYEITCGTSENISWKQAFERVKKMNGRIIDIREPGEVPEYQDSEVEKIPMKQLLQEPQKVENSEEIFLFCRSGKRSSETAAKLKEKFPEKKIFSIEGGILASDSPINPQK